jgi:hypothetical protein
VEDLSSNGWVTIICSFRKIGWQTPCGSTRSKKAIQWVIGWIQISSEEIPHVSWRSHTGSRFGGILHFSKKMLKIVKKNQFSNRRDSNYPGFRLIIYNGCSSHPDFYILRHVLVYTPINNHLRIPNPRIGNFGVLKSLVIICVINIWSTKFF